MTKLKAAMFVLIVGFLHVCCVFYFIADRISRAECNIPPYTGCETPMSNSAALRQRPFPPPRVALARRTAKRQSREGCSRPTADLAVRAQLASQGYRES
jgi:hypothetical protein